VAFVRSLSAQRVDIFKSLCVSPSKQAPPPPSMKLFYAEVRSYRPRDPLHLNLAQPEHNSNNENDSHGQYHRRTSAYALNQTVGTVLRHVQQHQDLAKSSRWCLRVCDGVQACELRRQVLEAENGEQKTRVEAKRW
jgi:hypothetical protein